MSIRDIVSSVIFYLGLVLASYLLIRLGTTYGVEKVHLTFTAMEPRLERGNHVWVNKRARAPDQLSVGDIIVYRRPLWKRAEYSQEFARVVGLPGDIVEMRDYKVYRAERANGKLGPAEVLSEPYVDPRYRPLGFSPFVVPRNTVLVMYDYRRTREPLRNLLIPARSILGRVIR